MFFLISSIFALEFSLRLKDSEIYMGGTNMIHPEAVDKSEADIMILNISKSYPYMNMIQVFTKDNNLLETDNDKRLIYGTGVDSRESQHFLLAVNPDGSYKLVTLGKCIDFDENSGFFMSLKCKENEDNQKFEVEIVNLISMNIPIPLMKNTIERSIKTKNGTLGRTHVANLLKMRRMVKRKVGL